MLGQLTSLFVKLLPLCKRTLKKEKKGAFKALCPNCRSINEKVKFQRHLKELTSKRKGLKMAFSGKITSIGCQIDLSDCNYFSSSLNIGLHFNKCQHNGVNLEWPTQTRPHTHTHTPTRPTHNTKKILTAGCLCPQFSSLYCRGTINRFAFSK